MPDLYRPRPVGLLDIAASCAATILPRTWSPRVDQLRLDLRAVLDGIQGHHERPFRDASGGPRKSAPLSRIDPLAEALPRHAALRYTAIRRDLSVLVDGVAGRHPPPFSRRRMRAPTSKQGASGTMTEVVHPRPLVVTRIDHPTRDTVTLHLADPAGAPFAFSAGQFVTVLVEVDGRSHRRAYSICTAPGDPGFAITIKRVDGGVVSSHLHSHAAVGATLRVLGPSGSFVWSGDGHEDVVLVAAGSGVTPVMSILRSVLAHTSSRRAALLFGSRSEDEIIFRRELDELRQLHADRFSLRHVLSRPSAAWQGDVGHIDRSHLQAFLDTTAWSAGPNTRFYVCGPSAMMDTVRAFLLDRGVDAGRILHERFATPHADANAPSTWTPQPMTVCVGSVETTVTVQRGQTLLEAGLLAGLPFKFSCMMGGCAACKVKVRSGAVHMGEPNALTSAERDEGHALACIARPVEPVKVELA